MTAIVAVGSALAVVLAGGAIRAARARPVRDRLGSAPSVRRGVRARVGAAIRWTPPTLEDRLEALGRARDLDAMRGTAAVCAVVGGVVALAVTAPSPLAALAAPLGATAGWRIPGFLLARRATGERERAAAEVPNLLDLVAIGLSAGLTPRLALDRAVDHVGSPLAVGLSRGRREVALGSSWPVVLHDLARRQSLPAVRRLAATLERSIRLGAPATDPVRALARDVRGEREAELEARARRAPVSMLFPLVLCILPAFVLAAVVPAMLVATRGVP